MTSPDYASAADLAAEARDAAAVLATAAGRLVEACMATQPDQAEISDLLRAAQRAVKDAGIAVIRVAEELEGREDAS